MVLAAWMDRFITGGTASVFSLTGSVRQIQDDRSPQGAVTGYGKEEEEEELEVELHGGDRQFLSDRDSVKPQPNKPRGG